MSAASVQIVIRVDARPTQRALMRAKRAFLHLELALEPYLLRRVVLRYRIWKLRHA